MPVSDGPVTVPHSYRLKLTRTCQGGVGDDEDPGGRGRRLGVERRSPYWDDCYLPSILITVVPQLGQFPFTALRPFCIVTTGPEESTPFLQLTQ